MVKSALATLVGVGVFFAASAAIAPSAQAEVWDCNSYYNTETASAYCDEGYGSYRVKANCASPRYPYNITIYGPTITKVRGQLGDISRVWASDYNCNITTASIQVF
ncbi:hypothetical protein ACFQVD_24830 [Streptosporangium amethystogenes subsp. fukuiense]|uniref:Uncharacterized protein n=1 Tax=Streptosporangium amethystogenes subsp. fukuiense TaxID=698418 RepID=A0ABW2T3X5_9ACTN